MPLVASELMYLSCNVLVAHNNYRTELYRFQRKASTRQQQNFVEDVDDSFLPPPRCNKRSGDSFPLEIVWLLNGLSDIVHWDRRNFHYVKLESMHGCKFKIPTPVASLYPFLTSFSLGFVILPKYLGGMEKIIGIYLLKYEVAFSQKMHSGHLSWFCATFEVVPLHHFPHILAFEKVPIFLFHVNISKRIFHLFFKFNDFMIM